MKYIKKYLDTYGMYTVNEKKFSEVDYCILAQFSYLKFATNIGKLSENMENISLKDMSIQEQEDKGFIDKTFSKNNAILFETMQNSRRFATLSVNYYANVIDSYMKTQFSAITCFMNNGDIIVVYQGTDEHIVGWEEDFYIAFKNPTVGQLLSALYLEQVANRVKGNLIICGHSKGGNFATYAAMHVNENIQKRISVIYNFDSPGFREEIIVSDGYQRIKDKIVKIVPKSAMVGMFLQSNDPYTVIKSDGMGMLQHNPFTWVIEADHYKVEKELYKRRDFLNHAFNRWLIGLEEDDLQVFINTLFEVIYRTERETVTELRIHRKENIFKMIKAYQNLDKSQKKLIKVMWKKYVRELSSREGSY